ncbi:hypothetical protein ACFYV7_25430 [Nocardia suismassiliense]|uniref:Uncharacterized protein n=1 Tax=Nocardia suismassiliense TaxID=2077092 RepID=A0ABW6QY39_9NOCA
MAYKVALANGAPKSFDNATSFKVRDGVLYLFEARTIAIVFAINAWVSVEPDSPGDTLTEDGSAKSGPWAFRD